MNRINSPLLALLVISMFIINSTSAQNGKDELTLQEKEITVDSVCNKLLARYVFPAVAEDMADLIRKNLKKGKYTSINNPNDFAYRLTEDLLSVSHDKHIHVDYDPEGIKADNEVITEEDSLNYFNSYIADIKRENFGFKELKILAGNIGYLDLRSFSNVEYGGPTAVSAMNFLSNSDAIIIDLRMNGGGYPTMIQLITSYLFDSNPVHLNSFYWRPTDENTQTWTLPYVQGKRSPKTPVYVLTSRRTFSAAEEFSYNLKNLERATLIGETTGGGAHPGGPVNATDKFTINIPVGRAINPITNTNWEGVGVKPHYETPSQEALDVAQIKALEALLSNCNDEGQKKYYQWHLRGVRALNEPVFVEKTILESYTGEYGPRKVSIENGTLYYQRGNGNKYELMPLNNNEFMLEGNSSFRVKFIVKNGHVIKLEGHYDNGYTDENEKIKD